MSKDDQSKKQEGLAAKHENQEATFGRGKNLAQQIVQDSAEYHAMGPFTRVLTDVPRGVNQLFDEARDLKGGDPSKDFRQTYFNEHGTSDDRSL